jgi:hypothetical protein
MGMGMFGAMAGLGEAGQKVGQQLMAASLKEDEMRFLEQRQNALLEKQERMKRGGAEKDRTERMGRIDTAKTGLLNSAIGQKYAGSDAAVAAAQSGATDGQMTPEQLAVIEQSKGADRAKLEADPMTDLRAEHAAGEMSGKDFAKVVFDERRADRADASAYKKAEIDAANLALKERGLDIRDKQVMAMIAKVGSSGGGGSGSVGAFTQQFDKIKKEAPGWSAEQILTYMNQAKTPGESYSQTESVDPLTKDVIVKTTRKGSGSPAAPSTSSTSKPWERKW